jgi:hypothetical protein
MWFFSVSTAPKVADQVYFCTKSKYASPSGPVASDLTTATLYVRTQLSCYSLAQYFDQSQFDLKLLRDFIISFSEGKIHIRH